MTVSIYSTGPKSGTNRCIIDIPASARCIYALGSRFPGVVNISSPSPVYAIYSSSVGSCLYAIIHVRCIIHSYSCVCISVCVCVCALYIYAAGTYLYARMGECRTRGKLPKSQRNSSVIKPVSLMPWIHTLFEGSRRNVAVSLGLVIFRIWQILFFLHFIISYKTKWLGILLPANICWWSKRRQNL